MCLRFVTVVMRHVGNLWARLCFWPDHWTHVRLFVGFWYMCRHRIFRWCMPFTDMRGLDSGPASTLLPGMAGGAVPWLPHLGWPALGGRALCCFGFCTALVCMHLTDHLTFFVFVLIILFLLFLLLSVPFLLLSFSVSSPFLSLLPPPCPLLSPA